MKLFEELKIKNKKFKNRIAFPPTMTCMGVDSNEALEYYTARAKGGVGLLIAEGTNVNSFKDNGFCERIARLAKSIKGNGAVAVIQLTAPTNFNGEDVWISKGENIRAITLNEIDEIIEGFGNAALKAEKAGFDGIDIHGAHHFFFNLFFSPIHNKRNDEYGGSLENRMRLGLNVVKSIRKAVSDNFLIFYRHSPEEGEWGYSFEESLLFAEKLQEAGVDVLDVSPGRTKKGEIAGYAAEFKKKLNIPVMTVGGFHIPESAEEALSEGKCDIVGIGRGMIADPEWAKKVQEGREDEIIKCLHCNKGCYGSIAEGRPIDCEVNKK